MKVRSLAKSALLRTVRTLLRGGWLDVEPDWDVGVTRPDYKQNTEHQNQQKMQEQLGDMKEEE